VNKTLKEIWQAVEARNGQRELTGRQLQREQETHASTQAGAAGENGTQERAAATADAAAASTQQQTQTEIVSA
jgi:hypothetical protein